METQTKEVQTLSLSGDKPNKEKKCSELVKEKYQDRLKQFKNALSFFDKDEEQKWSWLNDNPECDQYDGYDNFFDYCNQAGLCFDRVEAGTFKDQRAAYWRWQLSYGGPSEEFRLYDNNDLEYWYLDWFDGACVDVVDDVFVDIINDFKSCSVEE